MARQEIRYCDACGRARTEADKLWLAVVVRTPVQEAANAPGVLVDLCGECGKLVVAGVDAVQRRGSNRFEALAPPHRAAGPDWMR